MVSKRGSILRAHALVAIILLSFVLVCPVGFGRTVGTVALFSSPRSSGFLPVANFTYSPESPLVNQPVHFYDHSYETNGTIVRWVWDFNGTVVNATTPEEANQTFTFTAGGPVTVLLTVFDAQEYAASTYSVVLVQKISTFLSLDPPESTGQGNEVVLTATLTGDGYRVSAVPVAFYVNDSRGNNILIDVGFTDGIGRASVSFEPQSSGWVKAVFNGTAVYGAATSNVQAFEVGLNVLPYAVLASVAILVMSVIVAYLRWRSRKSAEAEEEEPSELKEEEGEE